MINIMMTTNTEIDEFYSTKILANIHQIDKENVTIVVKPDQFRYFDMKKDQTFYGIFL